MVRPLRTLFGVLTAIGLFALLLFPLPRLHARHGEKATCFWEDGSVSEEAFCDLAADVVGVTENCLVEVKRGTHVGHIAPSKALIEAYNTLRGGSLAEMLRLDGRMLVVWEMSALFRTFSSTVFYDDGAFAYTGPVFERTNALAAREVRLLNGGLPSGYLASLGAEKLHLSPSAQFSASMLLGSAVSEAEGRAPYAVEGNVIFLDTAGGRRLVAVLPHVETLTADGYDYLDRGALVACQNLRTLDLASCSMDLAALFYDGSGYAVPESFTTVRIRSGSLSSTAFYQCPQLKRINLCGVEAVEDGAFAGMSSLLEVHTPYGGGDLVGFSSYLAPCGCTIYRRVT